jgi:hypothetical protein
VSKTRGAPQPDRLRAVCRKVNLAGRVPVTKNVSGIPLRMRCGTIRQPTLIRMAFPWTLPTTQLDGSSRQTKSTRQADPCEIPSVDDARLSPRRGFGVDSECFHRECGGRQNSLVIPLVSDICL